MTRVYDNWDRLVGATLRREELRLIGLRNESDLSTASFSLVSSTPRASSFDFSILSLGSSFTYLQIHKATDSLSDSNLIKKGHSGDLYYGVLEGGMRVVIKGINLSSVRAESPYYTSELEFLLRVSHSRLVPLLGHCLENMYEMFLVYEYMPKKDLSSYLYRESPLDWTTRLKIATGAAEGLCYMHHKCDPPIAHRDVQPSSILLDENFEVRLGSLNEVCPALARVAEENAIVRLFRLRRGTEGEPKATCAHDVYCFGKVLLQLVTGRLLLDAAGDSPGPSSPVPLANNWKDLMLQIYDKELVRSILDPTLTAQEDIFLEAWAVAIVALACLNPKPSKRLEMAQVLKGLKNRKISQRYYSEMARTVEAHKTFLGPISPRIFR